MCDSITYKINHTTGNVNYEFPTVVKIPYICPVCGGRGHVPNGFYNLTSNINSSSSTEPEKCRTCHGTGIVWG